MTFVSSLDSLKNVVEKHLKRELDIFEMVFRLKENDLKKFLRWYTEHPFVKGIEEVIRSVREKANSGRTNSKTERNSTKFDDHKH